MDRAPAMTPPEPKPMAPRTGGIIAIPAAPLAHTPVAAAAILSVGGGLAGVLLVGEACGGLHSPKAIVQLSVGFML